MGRKSVNNITDTRFAEINLVIIVIIPKSRIIPKLGENDFLFCALHTTALQSFYN